MKNYTCSRTKLTPLPVYTMICTRKCTRLTKHERTTWWFMDFGQIFCLKSNPNWRPKSTKYSNTIYKSLEKFKRPKLLAYWPVRKCADVVQWSSTSPISGIFIKRKRKEKLLHKQFFSGIAKKSSRNPSYSEAQMSTSPKTCLENSENIVTNWPNSWERLVLLEMNSNWSFDRNFFSSHIIISSLLRTTIFLLSWPTGNVETLFFDQFIFLYRMFKTFSKIFEKKKIWKKEWKNLEHLI